MTLKPVTNLRVQKFPTEYQSLCLCAYACQFAYEDESMFLAKLQQKYPDYYFIDSIIGKEYDIHAYLTYNDKYRTGILVFRGTTSLDNWIANLNPDHGGGIAWAYTGFKKAYECVRKDLVTAINKMNSEIGGCENFFLTGHSLGAALAIQAKLDLLGLIKKPDKGKLNFETNLIALPNTGNSIFIEKRSLGITRFCYIKYDPVLAAA